MVPALVEKIWLQAGLEPSYLVEIRQICLSSNPSPDEADVSDEAKASSEVMIQLPLLFCEVHSGDRDQVIPAITACTLLRHAARLLDDIEDGNVKSRNISEPVALNVSTGILFTVGLVLNSLEAVGLPSETAVEIRRVFYEELLKVCSGQHLDLTQTAPTLEECWQIAGAKSGVFVGLVCWVGGQVAGADPEKLELYRQFGYNLGLLDEIRDDLADLWSNESHFSDLQNGRYGGLPVAYALSVLPENEQRQLRAHLAGSKNAPEAEQKARELIVQSGAGAYLMVQSAHYFRESQQLLTEMKLPAEIHDRLNALLEKVRLPAVKA